MVLASKKSFLPHKYYKPFLAITLFSLILCFSLYVLSLSSAHLIEINSNIILKSECDCRQNENVNLRKSNSSLLIVESSKKIYQLDHMDSLVFTCDPYNSLRRGKDLKLISYSLYGKNAFYSKLLPKLAMHIKNMYPGWIMRIYHDDSIEPKLKCEMECLKEEDNLIDNVDFCHINKIPTKNFLETTWNADYMHAMMWRWLPMGDSFVNVFMSRDSDSLIIQRELDSVNVWLASNKTAHIMRGKFCLFLNTKTT